MEGYLEYPQATHRLGEKLTVTSHCGRCPWSAEHTDEDVVRLAGFLRDRLFDHVLAAHPEDFPTLTIVHLVPEKESAS